MAGKQIDFPPLQKEVPWLTWLMLILSLVCIGLLIFFIHHSARSIQVSVSVLGCVYQSPEKRRTNARRACRSSSSTS